MMRATHIKLGLVLALAGAQIADTMTTNAFLARGGTEANPVMAGLQHALGGGWAIPKLAIAAVLVGICAKVRTRREIALASAIVTVAAGAPIWNVVTHALGLAV